MYHCVSNVVVQASSPGSLMTYILCCHGVCARAPFYAYARVRAYERGAYIRSTAHIKGVVSLRH